ncbi:MAG: nitrate reductase cytochrome c-type subunit [Chromatiaceae bacterium]|nr:nitrate reductase cytochrome c-type subunit [Chromatiaceae bacterium]
MKPSLTLLALLVTGQAGLAGQVLAGVVSLRGDLPIPVTEPAPEPYKYINNKENIPRNFEQQPPLVPHTNEKYAINLKENGCLECHMKGPEEDEAKSVEMSESHFTDRNGSKLVRPAGSRYFCNQCHVPQADAKALVENRFQPATLK